MALFDDILSQPAILVSIGVAFLLIIVAVVLTVLPRIKANRARAQKRKAAQLAEQRATMREAGEDGAAEEAVAKKPVKGSTPSAPIVSGAAAAKMTAQAAQAAPAAAAATPAAPAPAAEGAKPAAATSLAATLTGGSTTEKKEDEVSPEMQDLLSSVFSDEENSERQAILLKGTEPVAIDELLTLAKAVAAQLHGEQPSNIVRVKENDLT